MIWRVVAARHVWMRWKTTFGNQPVDFFLTPTFKLQILVVRVLRLLVNLWRS